MAEQKNTAEHKTGAGTAGAKESASGTAEGNNDNKKTNNTATVSGTAAAAAATAAGGDDKKDTLPQKVNYYDIVDTDNTTDKNKSNMKTDINDVSTVGGGRTGGGPGGGNASAAGGAKKQTMVKKVARKSTMTQRDLLSTPFSKKTNGLDGGGGGSGGGGGGKTGATTWKTTITTTVNVDGRGGGGSTVSGNGRGGSTSIKIPPGGSATVTFSKNSSNNPSTTNKRSATDANLDISSTKTGNNSNSSSNNAVDDDDDEGSDDGCLHCHTKVKNLPYIRKSKSSSGDGGGGGGGKSNICDAKKEPKGDRDDDDVDDDDGDDEDDDGEGKSNIQVRCDECGSYICRNCHWCHEYQANHEIRVCDRCDGFYCKTCDEMDQCDDCHEVVCGGCSTLLSCKFCGGGLCEDCATACGRCGIVLCSRDAKFAVDCDTCRLSYCLVCLASGSKEPCVRCGHRPSKRMEQLVHLRLKSIYKAFKSTKGGTPGSDGSSVIGNESSQGLNPNDHTSARSLRSKKKGDLSLYEEFLNANKVGGSHRKDASGGNDGQDETSASEDLKGQEKFCHDLEQNYLAEKKKADDAAAELLAELEEEEVKAQKKSKKKKKKGKAKSKQQDDDVEDTMESKENFKEGSKQRDGKQNSDDTHGDSSDEEDGFDHMLRVASGLQNVEISGEEEDATSGGHQDRSTKINDEDEDDGVDPVEKEIEECIESSDMYGIEEILERLKGVPGRAVLRKNAKKALKRLKAELEPAVPESETEPESSRKMSAADAKLSVPGATVTSSDKDTSYQSTTRSSYYTPRADTIVKIKSRLVGWMIGKGGQRIRDIMEESGAKIWIDQEATDAVDWRNVNINGDATSRELALALINEVVENAPPPPGSTTKDEIEIIYASSDLKSGEVSAWSSNAEKPAVLTAGGSTSATQTSSAAETAKAGTALEILTCEPRFVALLIGKRGWTIKNIQDESGARVDINQNVTPRQIKISGTRTSVDRAVGLVQDVLSYPHAQLHGTDNDANEPIAIPVLTSTLNSANETPVVSASQSAFETLVKKSEPEEKHVAAEASPEDQVAKLNETTGEDFPALDRNESPPPIVGDAKSAISASSSLSSTPEPSMASSAKGLLAAAAAQLPVPVLPPTPEKYILTKSESAPLASGSYLHSDPILGNSSEPNAATARVASNQKINMPMSVHHYPPLPGNHQLEAGPMQSVAPPGLGLPVQSTFNPQLGTSMVGDQLQQPTGSDRDGSVASASRPAMDYIGARQVKPQPQSGTSPTARRSTAGMTRAQIIASTPLAELMGNPGLSRSSSSPIGSNGYERDDGRRSGSSHSRGYPHDGPSGYGRDYDRDGRRYVEGGSRGYDRDDSRRFARSHSSEGAQPPEVRRGYDDRRSHQHPRQYGRYEDDDARRSYHSGIPPRSYGARYEEERRSYQGANPRPYDDAGRRPASATYQTRPPPASYERGYERGYDRGYDREYDRHYEAETGGQRMPPMQTTGSRSFSSGAPGSYAPGIRPVPHGMGGYGQEHYHADSAGTQQQDHRQGELPIHPSFDNSNGQNVYSRDSQDYRGQHLGSVHQDSHGTTRHQMFSSASTENFELHKTDELGIIDSLFGGQSSADEMNAATDSLLAGLTGLGLSGGSSKPTGNTVSNAGGLWGPTSLSGWGGNGEDGMDAIGASLGDLISGTPSSAPQQSTEHQEKSQKKLHDNYI